MKYIIITPVRDEAKFVGRTIESVLAQTVLPDQWIFVDDNSKDETPEIIARFSQKHPFIQMVKFERPTVRTPGQGVIRAFNFGDQFITVEDWELIVKFDADIVIEKDYFERILKEFEADPTLGIASGMIYELDGRPPKRNIAEHTYGFSKVYRRSCYEAIRPIDAFKTWDLVDNLRAKINGYTARIVPEAKAVELKPMESAAGKYRENYLKGYYNGYMCYLPAFAMVKATKTFLEPPFIVGGFVYLGGYLYNRLIDRKQYEDKRVIALLRAQQKGRLLSLLPFGSRRKQYQFLD